MSLCSDLHKCFSHSETFFSQLVFYFLPQLPCSQPYFLETLTSLNCSFTWFFLSRDGKSGKLGMGENALPLVGRRLWQHFCPRKTGYILHWLIFLSPALVMRRSFSDLYCENLLSFLKEKHMKVRDPLGLQPQMLSLQHFLFLNQPTLSQ